MTSTLKKVGDGKAGNTELQTVIKDMRKMQTEWEPTTSIESEDMYQTAALLTLAENFNMHMEADECAVDVLEPTGTLASVKGYPRADKIVNKFERGTPDGDLKILQEM